MFWDSQAHYEFFTSPGPWSLLPHGRPTEGSSSLPRGLSCVGSLPSSVLSPVFHLCVSCSTLWDVSSILFPNSSTEFFLSTFIFLTSKSSFVCSKLPCLKSALVLGPVSPLWGPPASDLGAAFAVEAFLGCAFVFPSVLRMPVCLSHVLQGTLGCPVGHTCVYDGIPWGPHVLGSLGLVQMCSSTSLEVDRVWRDIRVCSRAVDGGLGDLLFPEAEVH